MEKKVKKLLNKLNHLKKNTFIDMMQIKFIYLSPCIDSLIAKMPINKKNIQPFGFIHGGAIITLAESVGSSLSLINIKKNINDNNKYNIFNIEISANHIKCVKKGFLLAKAKIIHKGKTIHFIQANIFNEEKKLISLCKMTNIIIMKKKN
ncbi:PaaI family thioesterase [Blattabacterium cuenoti]|uniref:PaaI family thioesterase n=1 Tax=Blattabacterium cuenoti TaxID=1653831 RepID=UPI00163BC5A2|nr:PaaI family thioesterase [Blattabacterium cuenoti]